MFRNIKQFIMGLFKSNKEQVGQEKDRVSERVKQVAQEAQDLIDQVNKEGI